MADIEKAPITNADETDSVVDDATIEAADRLSSTSAQLGDTATRPRWADIEREREVATAKKSYNPDEASMGYARATGGYARLQDGRVWSPMYGFEPPGSWPFNKKDDDRSHLS